MQTATDFCGLRLEPVPVAAEPVRCERLSDSQQSDLIRELMYWQDAGKTPLPLLLGEKHPGEGWRRASSPTAEVFGDMVRANKTQGIGVPLRETDVVIDVEGRARSGLALVTDAAAQLGLMPLLNWAVHGLVEETPSGGLHVHLTLLNGSPSRKQVLARRPQAGDPSKSEVLVEALGFGQQVVVAPSGGLTHATGKSYRRICGDPFSPAAVTWEECEKLFKLFRRLDEMPLIQSTVVTAGRRPETLIERDFNERKPWREILEPHGWRWQRSKKLPTGGLVDYWTRPGKSGGTSASTCGKTLCVFSTEAGLPNFEPPVTAGGRGEGSLSKFEVFTLLNHDGDRDAALRAAFHEGFGRKLPARRKTLSTDVPDAVAFLSTCFDSAVSTGPKSKAEITDIAIRATPPGVLLRIINRERRSTGKPMLKSFGDARPQAVQWACEWVSRRAIQRLIASGNVQFSDRSWVLKRKES